GGGIGEGAARRVFCRCLLPAASSGDPPSSGIVSGRRPRCGLESPDAHGSLQDTWNSPSRTAHEHGPI
ncbi:unnamed protein product, partial [Urochloa humidicola]